MISPDPMGNVGREHDTARAIRINACTDLTVES